MSDPTYVTVADSAYFLGAVALVNSLRLTGNDGPIVVLDGGLTDAQKETLAPECDVREIPVDTSGTLPLYFKPLAARLGLRGVVAYLDSDIIVTSHLEPLIAPARQGKLSVFADGIERRFAEWERLLGLAAPLRDQPYVNAGFFVGDVDVWAPTFERWWKVLDHMRQHREQNPWGYEDFGRDREDPFFYHDQDALNAILMSEVEPGRISFLDRRLFGVPGWPVYEAGGTIVDRRSLVVNGDDGRRLAFLHYWDYPKPWLPGARTKMMLEGYVELMARLLTADDVPISLPPSQVPAWLRDDRLGRLARRGPRKLRRSVKRVLGRLPHSVSEKAIAAGQTFLNRGKP